MDQTLVQKALRTNIVELLGLQSLTEEKKLQLVNMLTELVGTKLMMRIDEKLSPEDQAAFEKALDTETELAAWLKEKGIDMEQMMLEEIARVKDDLMARAQANGVT